MAETLEPVPKEVVEQQADRRPGRWIRNKAAKAGIIATAALAPELAVTGVAAAQTDNPVKPEKPVAARVAPKKST